MRCLEAICGFTIHAAPKGRQSCLEADRTYDCAWGDKGIYTCYSIVIIEK